MAALTSARNTELRHVTTRRMPVKASVRCFAGGIAVLSAGYAAPATTATGLIVLGRFNETVDNSTGANAAKFVEVEAGEFHFANSASTDQIGQTEIGKNCYLVDDQTVAKTDGGGTRSIAGIVTGFDSRGVWVKMGF